MRILALACLAVLAACDGAVGTITIELVASPGSDVLSRVQRVRLELDNPPTVAEAERSGDGLVLDLEVDATGAVGLLELEAFDASGNLIGVSFSAPLPLSSIDGALTLFVAPPMSIEPAPVSFESARSNAAIARLAFGAVFAGGRDDSGEAISDLLIYNVYDHAFQVGELMAAPASDQAIAVGSGGVVYLFGGRDASGELSASYTAFDTNVAPAGRYLEFESSADLARAEAAAHIGGERVVVLGDPPVLLSEGLAAVGGNAALAGTITATEVGGFDIAIAIGEGTGSTGAATVQHNGALVVTEVAGSDELLRVGHGATALPGGDVLVAGGTVAGQLSAAAVRYRSALGDVVIIDDFLATPRLNPAIAATETYIIVAGGSDSAGAVVPTAELFDVATLQPAATLDLPTPRTGGSAVALGNGQILLTGGLSASSTPTATIDLFTPN